MAGEHVATCSYNSEDEEGHGGGITVVGAAMASIGGILIGHGDWENHGTHLLVWANLWFATGCLLLALGTAMVGVGALTMILKWKRSRERRLTPTDPQDPGRAEEPLRAVVIDEEWSPVRDVFCTFALRIEVINLTDGPINLLTFNLVAKVSGKIAPIAIEAWNDISNSMAEMKAMHSSELLMGPTAVPSLNRITGWLVSYGTIPIPEGGRPPCELSAVDNRGNSYELFIAPRPQQRYKSPDKR